MSRFGIIVAILLSITSLSLSVFSQGGLDEDQEVTSESLTTQPISILYTGNSYASYRGGVVLQINSNNVNDLDSTCEDVVTVLAQSSSRTLLLWEVGDDCSTPIVMYRGKTYLVPLSDRVITTDIISDISSETLRNTQQLVGVLGTDIRFSSVRSRKTL